MIKVGQFNQLTVIKEVAFGVYLDGGTYGEILLPNKYLPKGTQVGAELKVFVYFDSEDRIIATTLIPKIQLGTCASLKVIDVNRVGAFLDWGLDKDLLVPGPEQQKPMVLGKLYLVYLKLDNKGRLIASSKLDHFLDKTPATYKVGEEIQVLIAETTDLGVKVIINNHHWGLLHKADIFKTLHYGSKVTAYIKSIRADGKIDVALRKMGGGESRSDLAQRIMSELRKREGFLPLHDKSSPIEIQQALGDSKKNFKNAIGHLYKQGEIIIEVDGIRLK